MSIFNNYSEFIFNRLVIVQSKKQLNHYKKNNFHDDDLILSFDPSVLYNVENNKLKIILLKDILEDDSYDKSSIDSINRVNTLIDNLNSFSNSLDKKIDIGNYYAFQIWVVIGQIHYNYHICKAIKSKIDIKNILLYTCNSEKLLYDYRPNPENIFFNIFTKSELFISKNIKNIKINKKKKVSFKELVRSIIPKELLSFIYDLKSNEFHLGNFILKNKKKLLLVGPGYEWTRLSYDSKFNSEFIVKKFPEIKSKNKFKCPDAILNFLSNSVTFSETIVYDLNYLGKFIYNDLIFFSKSYLKIKNRIINYDAVVGSVFTKPYENFYAHIAKTLKKPVIIYQHGEKGQSFDVTAKFTELYYCSDYFSYGNEVSKQYLNYLKFRKISKVYTVGSLDKSVEWKGGESIVYVTGKWFKTASPFPVKIDPDYRTYNAHIKLLNLFNKFKKEKFFFKKNNTISFNEIVYEDDYPHVEFNTKLTFTDLLIHAKLVIIDTPATTLVESCSTKIPIFVLGGRINYNKSFLKSVSKRVVWCNDIDILASKVEDFLKTGLYEADVNNNEYYYEYCNSCKNKNESINKIKNHIYNSINEIKS
jgi:hypothetical protein